MTIRTSAGSIQKYGCTRRWRRGAAACGNSLLIRRDGVESQIVTVLREKLYSPSAIRRLVEKVNARLHAQTPAAETERRRLLDQLQRVKQQLLGLRQFITTGDTSAKVRTWLAEAEAEEARLEREVANVEAHLQRPLVQIHPGRVAPYLDDLRATLQQGGVRARRLLQGDIERINIHRATDGTKPFARAELHQERGCPTRPQPEPYQGGNRGPKRITGDAVPRRDKDGGLTRPRAGRRVPALLSIRMASPALMPGRL